MGRIIAVANQKGGVGKTTTCVNLGYALYKRGKRVLLCDADPQGNCTSGMGLDKFLSPNLYDVLINGADVKSAIKSTNYGDVLPSNRELSGATVELVGLQGRESVLKDALVRVKSDYDYIFIDCPPSLEMLTVNALCAAESLLVPLQCEYFAMEGLVDLLATVRMIKTSLNPDLEIEGLLLTMSDKRTNFTEQVADEVRRHFGDTVYKTAIPRNVRVGESPSHGKPVIAYDRMSKGARAYLQFASEFLKRERDSGMS